MRIRKALKSVPLLYSLVQRVRHMVNYHRLDYGEMKAGELALFDAIKGDISTLFDVGARFNTDYSERSQGLPIQLYLFEPNPRFFTKLQNRLNDSRCRLFKFGLGAEDAELVYYEDTQSFSKQHQMMESKFPGKKLTIKTLDGFCRDHGVAPDFLKTDVESLDYHVLMGGKATIQYGVKCCQFEFGIGADFRGTKVTPQNYYDFWAEDFDLYVVKDEDHPMFREASLPVLVHLPSIRETFERHMYAGSGCNMFAIRRGAVLPDSVKMLMC